MKSLWSDKQVSKFNKDLLQLRVYSSRLLGMNPDLVLHGGGNTSVKSSIKNLFGEKEDILWVKGSGWDLATIEAKGFAPVRMHALLKMAKLKELSDDEMVRAQRAAMTDPYAPNPSVEAILHAIIPFRFVDHTHADAVVTLTNSPDGEKKVRKIYGNRMLIVPYVMPGFILARKIYEMTVGLDWSKYDGMILLNHGIFTFHDEAKISYENMIRYVSKAERYLKKNAKYKFTKIKVQENLIGLAFMRRAVSSAKGTAMVALQNLDAKAVHFSNLKNISSVARRGPLTPDHVIRTKRIPVVIKNDPIQGVESFVRNYHKYFQRHNDGKLKMIDPAPRWAVWQGYGVVNFGSSLKDAQIASDITAHTIRAILSAEKLGGWRALSERDMFEMEYWVLEQAKLKFSGKVLPFQGKIALVTGAAGGIGKACAETLYRYGAVVLAADVDPKVRTAFNKEGIFTFVADVTKENEVQKMVAECVRKTGGLDILVSNAGSFPPSHLIEDMNEGIWEKSLKINLTSHEMVLKACIPFLKYGIDPSVLFIASKNVPAPGPGASAYSAAKAGLTQMARIAALELAKDGIRVNVIHPNQVFDTAIWTKDVLKKRAAHYAMSVDEYKKSNLMNVEITSKDVAELVSVIAGPAFSKTTGAQIPIDGGNDRVI